MTKFKKNRIIIPGKFYDVILYSGKLHLWSIDGTLAIYDWDKLIDNIIIRRKLSEKFRYLFSRSSAFFNDMNTILIEDKDIKDILVDRINNILQEDLIIDEFDMESTLIYKSDDPFGFVHSDAIIYKYKVYVSGQNGLLSSNLNYKNKSVLSKRVKKHWDAYIFSIQASYDTIAISAGSDGLYNYLINDNNSIDVENLVRKDDELYLLSKNHSSSVSWTYHSIFSSSYLKEGFLADFSNEKKHIGNFKSYSYRMRRFEKERTNEEIFHSNGFSFGVKNRLYLIKENRQIEIYLYDPFSDERIRRIGMINLRDFKGNVIAATGTFFGVVIECKNGLVVVESEDVNHWIEGEPINWRVFPRSYDYENLLAVIKDNQLEILSFNNAFIDKEKKERLGISFYEKNRFKKY